MSWRMLVLVVVLGIPAAGLLYISAPRATTTSLDTPYDYDLENGRTLFWAGGCASCHAAPGSEGEDKLKLGGGLALPTPFGLFRVPNISPDQDTGIGRWDDLQFVQAMRDGISPEGEHYYPAFPYDYYRHMSINDLRDLKGFLDTLPAVSQPLGDNELAFPYNIRRGIGLWKFLYLREPGWIRADDAVLRRGEYLVRGPGHCGFCHTPRNALGGLIEGQFLAGAPALEVSADGHPEGKIPNITPHRDGLARWSAEDIAYALETGFDPDYDSFGGSMVDVQENMAMLSSEDRAAIGTYLKSVPPLPSYAGSSPE